MYVQFFIISILSYVRNTQSKKTLLKKSLYVYLHRKLLLIIQHFLNFCLPYTLPTIHRDIFLLIEMLILFYSIGNFTFLITLCEKNASLFLIIKEKGQNT